MMEFPTNPMLCPLAGFSTCGIKTSSIAVAAQRKIIHNVEVFDANIALCQVIDAFTGMSVYVDRFNNSTISQFCLLIAVIVPLLSLIPVFLFCNTSTLSLVVAIEGSNSKSSKRKKSKTLV